MDPIYGLVLAGGRSSRMGKDKGLLLFHGKPQREHLYDLLLTYCVSVYTSSYEGQNVPSSLNPLVDCYQLNSPLNGILTAFKKFPGMAWLAVAVDMPRVDRDVLNVLVRNRDAKKVATCYYNPDTKMPEPLLTIWEPSAYRLLLKFVENGNISPRDFLNTHDVQMVFPADTAIFQNVNTPEDLPS